MSYNLWLVNVSDGITVKTVIVFIIQCIRLHFEGTHSDIGGAWGCGYAQQCISWLCITVL